MTIKNYLPNKKTTILFCTFIIISISIAYLQTLFNGFIDFDDIQYITQNPIVKSGLNKKSIQWAFTTTLASNWHPVTWLSHMADVSIFGLNPTGHHLTSLLIHTLNSLLVFFFALLLTKGAKWQSLSIALLFALHPLNVESVAWAAERKNVLSTFFWMLSLLTYFYYIEKPTFQRYLTCLLTFTIGLMAKPMLVTLPFVFLLMDYWPLTEFKQKKNSNYKKKNLFKKLTLEKIPFFTLSIISSIITYKIQSTSGAVKPIESLTIFHRIANALTVYITYIGKMIWPAKLSIFYPYPDQVSLLTTFSAFFTILLFSISAIIYRKKFPFITTGWFWYLGTLIPVIGIVQVGEQSMADRYTYIPLVGLFIIITLSLNEIFNRFKLQKQLVWTLCIVLYIFFLFSTYKQTGYWHNKNTIYLHAIDCDKNNYLAHNSLANALADQNKTDKAIFHYKRALAIKPEYIDAHNNIAIELQRKNKLKKSIFHFSEVVRLSPGLSEGYNNLGRVLAISGNFKKALINFQQALKIAPYNAAAHYNFGNLLLELDRLDEAIKHFYAALKLMPKYAVIHNRLGITFMRKGETKYALEHFNRALKLNPNYHEAKKNLNMALQNKEK